MVVSGDRNTMEAPACNSRNGWRSSPLTTVCYGRVDSIDDTWVNKVPVIVPCYNGKSLQIHEELVVNGLSAISIKHHKGHCSDVAPDVVREVERTRSKNDKDAKEGKGRASKLSVMSRDSFKKGSSQGLPTCLGERIQRRNSFWNMHRPELSKLTWPQNFISSAMLQDFFHHHLRTHGTFCEPLHVEANRSQALEDETRDFTILRELVPPTILPPDEKAVNIMEKSRSVQLNDEDLDPEIMVHKSRAEFCVTIGEYVRRPPLKRSTSQQMTKSVVPSPAGRFEAFPVPQREGFLSKEELNAEELISSVTGSPTAVTLARLAGSHQQPADTSNTAVSASASSVEDLASRSASDQVTEDGGDPTRLRTILSPRDEESAGAAKKPDGPP